MGRVLPAPEGERLFVGSQAFALHASTVRRHGLDVIIQR